MDLLIASPPLKATRYPGISMPVRANLWHNFTGMSGLENGASVFGLLPEQVNIT